MPYDTNSDAEHEEYRRLKLNALDYLYQPGDLILDRYMPNATDKKREETCERQMELFEFLYRKAEMDNCRLAREADRGM